MNDSSLRSSYENQDKVFAAAFSELEAAIAVRAFPAASISVAHQGRLIALKAFGKDVHEAGDFGVTPATIFDLASLTKVVATTTMAMILYERGQLELDGPLMGIVPEFLRDSTGELDERRREVTFRMLLAHSSGLPAYDKLFLKARSRDELLRAAFAMPLSAHPGTHAAYSDIGFIVLGVALERLAQEPLDVFYKREVFGPLGMAHTRFNPPADMRAQIPPTANEREEQDLCGADTPVRQVPGASTQPNSTQPGRSTFRNKIIQGEVQDENAFVLGGVAPHAGLFSTAEDLARFANAMLQGGRPIVDPETVALFTRRASTPAGTTRALGWDTPSARSQSGRYFGPLSFGHLGYTGTSLWIDPERQLSITLLTNRTWPDCSNLAIKQVRPKVHDAVIEALERRST